jgi:hypothetical protein
MKIQYTLVIILLFASTRAKGQAISNSQSVEIRAGKTLSLGDYAALRYRHTTSTSIDLSIAAYVQGLQKNGLRHSAFGVDLLGEYYTGLGDKTDHLFECKLGIGGTVQLENEPWLYKDWPFAKRLNYGACAEVTGEYSMSENFSLSLFTQQKFLFNPLLGKSQITLGLGLVYHFD